MNRNTILTTKIRPTVIFNVEDRDHRYWAYKFVTERKWSDCPYVFAIPNSENNVYSMLCRELAEYYSDLEFNVADKPQGKLYKLKKS